MLLPRLLLASASPRRADLLRAAGFDFDVRAGTADETRHPDELPERYVRRVAEAKAATAQPFANGRVVLAADTVVVIDGQVLGKPVDQADARRMLRLLSGRRHSVLTAVSLARATVQTDVETTTVEFAGLTEEEVDWYVMSGEPDDKAGAYAVQGLASRFVRRIEGSYSNVVGLPMGLVYRMLRAEPG